MTNKSSRTDLAAEWAGRPDEAPEGVLHQQHLRSGVPVQMVEITSPAAAHRLGRPKGRYLTVETASFFSPVRDLEAEARALGEEMRALLPQKGLVLAVGLGNRQITPDALGPEAVRKMLVTRHLGQHLSHIPGLGNLRPVAAIAPGVLGQTGVESAELVAALTRSLSPAAVVVIDALAAADPARLGQTVQLSDVGLVPGSGVANHRVGLTAETLGVPVVAVGVPTVTEMTGGEATMVVTPREIDQVITRAASVIALGLGMATQPGMSAEALTALTAE